MTKQQIEATMGLLREYEHLIAENVALRALLEVVQRYGPYRDTIWQAQLQVLMRSQTREGLRQQFAPILQRIEEAYQDAELAELLAAYPQTGPVN